MRTQARVAALSAAAVAALSFSSAPALASSKPKPKPPVVALKASAKTALAGKSVSFAEAIHLPAKDKVKSWSMSFGDRTKVAGTAKNVPHSLRHTYKNPVKAKAVFTLTDVHKHSWSAAVVVTIVKPPVITPPIPIVITPIPTPVPPYVAPTGPITGHVTLAGVPQAGVSVTIESNDYYYGQVVTTNDHGDWAAMALPAVVAAAPDGLEVRINRDARYTALDPAGTNHSYAIYEDDLVFPNTAPVTSVNADLPALNAGVTGSITENGVAPSSNAAVLALKPINAISEYVIYGTVSGTTYNLTLPQLLGSWDVAGFDGSYDSLTTSPNATVDPALSTTGPALTLTYDSSSQAVTGPLAVARSAARAVARDRAIAK